MKVQTGKWFLAGLAAISGLAALLTPSAASLAKGPAQEYACPTTSTNSYVQGPVFQYDLDHPVRAAETNADKNLEFRGYGMNTFGGLGFHNYGHSSDKGLPPQLATLFRPVHVPTFTSGGVVSDWVWDSNFEAGGYVYGDDTDFEFTALGLGAAPGTQLHTPAHSRNLGAPFGKGGAIVLYANEDSITLKFTREDSVARGYTVHILGICTDPNLLALYQSLDNADRNAIGPGSGNHPRDLVPDYNLPGLTHGQVFGRVSGNAEVIVAVRDEGRFLDPRALHDWWRVR